MESTVMLRLATIFIGLSFMELGPQGVGAQVTCHVEVPVLADPREPAELVCHFYVPDGRLHSVKWYRERDEIFRYTPAQEPRMRLFNASSARVVNATCDTERCSVHVLARPEPPARYRCEVSSEGPRFLVAQDDGNLTVAALARQDPVITGAPVTVRAGDNLRLDCAADYSLPPAEVTWYINDQKAQFVSLEPIVSSSPTELGLVARSRAVRVLVTRALLGGSGGGELRVRCAATPPGHAGRYAELTVPTHLRHGTHGSEISKFVSNGAAAARRKGAALFASLLVALQSFIKLSELRTFYNYLN